MFSRSARAALALLAALALPGCAGGERAAPVSAAAAPGVAPLSYTSRTLANGLRVYALRDETSANVSIQVWYDVGSKDDPRGRSGFAHLFEHLMFKSTRNLVPEQFDRLTEDVGGYNNASTADDYTNYYEVVPANHLERLLWAEAERMGSLVVEQGFFASERDVVKEELRSRVLAQPYGRLFYLYFPQVSYETHPYGRPGIGSIEDLDSATIDDVRAFHATYYRPDNAVLVVAGNFDQAELDRWIDLYFAPIARPAGEIPRVRVEEPERSVPRSYTVYEPNTPLPAVLLSYALPPASHDDSAALEVLDGILSTGESSRLHQSLVYRQQLAGQASSFLDMKQGQGSLAVYAIMSSGRDAAAGEAALRAEVARFRDELVSPAELAEARNELLNSALRSRETVDGRASALAEAVIVRGDPEAADRRLARIAAVTPEDVRRVARRWLRDEGSAAIRYLPEEMRSAGAREDEIATAATVQTVPLTAPAAIPIVQPAPENERVAPPAPAAATVTALPEPVTQRLANGLTLVTVSRRELPLVSISLSVGGGSASDPQGKAGRATLTAALLTEGTATRSATEIDRAVEAMGTSLGSGADGDGMALGLTVRSDHADSALALISDIARNPAFAAEELERQRTQFSDALTVTMSDPGALSRLVAMRALYGAGPYGHPAAGTAASLRAITREDVLTAYRASWTPANATLVITGDVDAQAARALAERHFGSWTGTDVAPRPAPATDVEPAHRDVVVIDMPGAGQAAVIVVRNLIARSDPRFYRTLVANAVLGGGYSSRLNQEVRIRRGLAYGASSYVDARQRGGSFLAVTQTRNDAASEVLGLILAEMQRLGAEPIPPAELDVRRAVILGGFGRTVETTAGLADLIGGYVIDGVGPDEIGRYQRSVLAVTPEEARGAAAELLSPSGATMVIVGDAPLFVDQLRRGRSTVTVIPLSELDLDSPSLR